VGDVQDGAYTRNLDIALVAIQLVTSLDAEADDKTQLQSVTSALSSRVADLSSANSQIATLASQVKPERLARGGSVQARCSHCAPWPWLSHRSFRCGLRSTRSTPSCSRRRPLTPTTRLP